jgi:hypothetical protein
LPETSICYITINIAATIDMMLTKQSSKGLHFDECDGICAKATIRSLKLNETRA